MHRLCRGDEAIDEDAVVVLDDVGDGRVDFLPRLRFAREGKDEANASLLQNRANGLAVLLPHFAVPLQAFPHDALPREARLHRFLVDAPRVQLGGPPGRLKRAQASECTVIATISLSTRARARTRPGPDTRDTFYDASPCAMT